MEGKERKRKRKRRFKKERERKANVSNSLVAVNLHSYLTCFLRTRKWVINKQSYLDSGGKWKGHIGNRIEFWMKKDLTEMVNDFGNIKVFMGNLYGTLERGERCKCLDLI